MVLYLSVVCHNDQLHILGCPLRMPFMLGGVKYRSSFVDIVI